MCTDMTFQLGGIHDAPHGIEDHGDPVVCEHGNGGYVVEGTVRSRVKAGPYIYLPSDAD